jgi:hypothetical protein
VAGVAFKVTGGNQAHALAKRLKAFGDKGLEKELRRGISKAMKPATKAVRAQVPEYMPSGYAPTLSSALQLRTSNLAAGLRITGQAKGNPRPRKVTDLNRGILRHPVFGNREKWAQQAIRPRFFDEPLAGQRGQIRGELDRVLAEVAAKLAGG